VASTLHQAAGGAGGGHPAGLHRPEAVRTHQAAGKRMAEWESDCCSQLRALECSPNAQPKVASKGQRAVERMTAFCMTDCEGGGISGMHALDCRLSGRAGPACAGPNVLKGESRVHIACLAGLRFGAPLLGCVHAAVHPCMQPRTGTGWAPYRSGKCARVLAAYLFARERGRLHWSAGRKA
jgi:hypothetical protein